MQAEYQCTKCESICASTMGAPLSCMDCGHRSFRRYTETVLSREDFKAEFVAYLVERKWHPEVAADMFEMEMEEFTNMETEVWGDPAYYWDRDAAHEWAHEVHTARD